ncbi:MAG: phosphatidylglycerol lysyltransferase domain-containing protein [Candidatus Omnitrophica bacterium]|nr:phosphatidylglycerol lysyltransferase domain-containing protein [Candidatus Omnitrophota bacterium]
MAQKMHLNRISLEDKELFDNYLRISPHYLGAYAFESIYIWKNLYDILWLKLKNTLFVFFKDKFGIFLYLDLLSENKDPLLVKEAFRIMNYYNKNRLISRIENVEELEVNFYKEHGFKVKEKFFDYLYLKEALINLSGKKFKTKRNLLNFFLKSYKFKVFDYSSEYKDSCINLYKEWAELRKRRYKDQIYQHLLNDNLLALEVLLENYNYLNYQGLLVEIEDKICAFSFGYPLNKETFCIQYEIADLKIKGLAQFIFWFFCRRLDSYKYINTLDDSGLKNLRYTKLSYRPVKLVSNFIITQNEN